jgi:hypothetical protein
LDVRINGARYREVIPNARTRKQADKAEFNFRQKLFEALFDPKQSQKEEAPLRSDFIDNHFLPWSRANKRS